MTQFCSCPCCNEEAVWEATATNAGPKTGSTFYTCERHSMERDDRRWIGDGEPPEEATA